MSVQNENADGFAELLEPKPRKGSMEAKDYLADGLFAYQMIVEICKKELEELYEDGVKYFNLFINFVFDLYEELDRKEDEFSSMPDQKQSRYVELRTFIKTELFDDFLVVFLTRVGTDGLIKVNFLS